MVQHGVADAVVVNEPVRGCATFGVGVLVGSAEAGRAAEGFPAAEGVTGKAGWLPAVVLDPVRDGVLEHGRLVVVQAEPLPDFEREQGLVARAAGGEAGASAASR